ncbi:unnamed protein product [Urochloa humidicola]
MYTGRCRATHDLRTSCEAIFVGKGITVAAVLGARVSQSSPFRPAGTGTRARDGDIRHLHWQVPEDKPPGVKGIGEVQGFLNVRSATNSDMLRPQNYQDKILMHGLLLEPPSGDMNGGWSCRAARRSRSQVEEQIM